MEKEQTAKPKEGSWDNLETGEFVRKERVIFEMDKPQIITFSPDFKEPKELPNKEGDGVFYIFEVIHDGEGKVIMSSAWTLLRALKGFQPLAGKTLVIKKILKDGKQNYVVTNSDNIEVEKVGA